MLRSGKEEIVYLLDQVFRKYELTTGQPLRRNTNRKNYEDLARVLSEISNRLPDTADELHHDHYPPERNKHHLSYPNLKYDITGGQIKDACNGMVSHPRPFLVDACYIYLYGTGRKGFEKDPKDLNLVADILPVNNETSPAKATIWNRSQFWLVSTGILVLVCICLIIFTIHLNNKLKVIKDDMKIGIYQPTSSDIKALVGTWLVYIGSPQARRSDQTRYHLVVTNIVDVKYKNGYFLFKRYGANFNHDGFMQFESKNLVSIHSYLANNSDTIQSPRLSLFRIDRNRKYQSVISASWNFDTEKYNDIIGIREVYVKQNDGGTTTEILNTIENSTCKCKIINLNDGRNAPVRYMLKNIRLDTLPDQELRSLLNEHSILLRRPDSTTVIGQQSY